VEESPHELLRKELHRASAVHPKAQPKKDTPADQLAKLSALNSEGIIDNAQYRAAKSKVMAELTKQRAATPNAKQARASMPAGVAVVKDEQQQQQEQDGKEARDGTAHISEETREAQVDAKATTKPAVKTEAQQEAAATADAKTLAADTAAKKKKAKVHKLMDQDDPNEARILDRYHEYTEDDDQQYNAPPGQQGGEKLDPQQKSFFTDVKREAYKVDAKKNFPEDMLGAMDLDVEPCDDFYEYACGSFLKDAVIPDYLTAYTLTWDKAKSQVISETSELLTNDPGEAGTFYRTCLDEDVVEEAGATPLTAWFQAIAGVTDMDSLSSFLATAGTYNGADSCAGMCLSTAPTPTQTKWSFHMWLPQCPTRNTTWTKARRWISTEKCCWVPWQACCSQQARPRKARQSARHKSRYKSKVLWQSQWSQRNASDTFTRSRSREIVSKSSGPQ